ncbi:MAG: YraN family protein [Candidatus Aminicenantes bacterium]|nr:YraN family protein [Candidatus Aminicenantes bacterium]
MENREENRVELGRRGEEAAVRYLKREGFQVVERGYRFNRGEIDIVAYEGATLVFIEVKTRTDPTLGYPEEAVTPAKRRQIRRVAQGFLTEREAILNDPPCRFDVIAVEFLEDDCPLIRHFRDAF